jgi:hypothetical protein
MSFCLPQTYNLWTRFRGYILSQHTFYGLDFLVTCLCLHLKHTIFGLTSMIMSYSLHLSIHPMVSLSRLHPFSLHLMETIYGLASAVMSYSLHLSIHSTDSRSRFRVMPSSGQGNFMIITHAMDSFTWLHPHPYMSDPQSTTHFCGYCPVPLFILSNFVIVKSRGYVLVLTMDSFLLTYLLVLPPHTCNLLLFPPLSNAFPC